MSTVLMDLTTVIDRPIDEVFKNATCLKGCVNWQTATVSAEKIGDQPTGVGTQYHQVVKFMGMKTEVHPEIITYDAPHEFAYRDPDSPLSFEVRVRFTEVDGGTALNARIEGDMQSSLLGRIAKPVVAAAMKRQFETDLTALKDLLENDVTVHA